LFLSVSLSLSLSLSLQGTGGSIIIHENSDDLVLVMCSVSLFRPLVEVYIMIHENSDDPVLVMCSVPTWPPPPPPPNSSIHPYNNLSGHPALVSVKEKKKKKKKKNPNEACTSSVTRELVMA
jgi:hypothetical protein